MRKLKKFKEVYRKGETVALVERIKNDRNGNPKYQVDIIDNGEFVGTYNVVSYDIRKFIEEEAFEMELSLKKYVAKRMFFK